MPLGRIEVADRLAHSPSISYYHRQRLSICFDQKGTGIQMLICKADNEIELHLLEECHAGALLALEKGWQHQPQVDEPMYPCQSEDSIKAFIRASLSAFAEKKEILAGIWFRGTLVGVIQLRCKTQASVAPVTASIDYMLAPPYRGKGIMTRACRAMVGHAFTNLRLNRIDCWVDVKNTRSVAVPERLGFKREGVLRQWVCYGDDWFGDIAVYAVLRSEWNSSSS